MAQRATLPEGVVQPVVDPLTLEAMIQQFGLPTLRDTYYRHFGVESAGGRADTAEATIGASGERGGRGPMQVINSTFEGLRNQNYIPRNYSWDNPVHSTQAGLALFRELSNRYNTQDSDTLSALYYAGDAAVSKDKKGNLTINRNYKPRNNTLTVGQYLDRMAAQEVPEPFPTEQVAARRQEVENYLRHSIGVPYDYSLVDKVAAQQAPRQPAAAGQPDDKSFYARALDKIKEARDAGDAAMEQKVKEIVDRYAEWRGHKKKEQEENGD